MNLLLPALEHARNLGYWVIFLISMAESFVILGLFVPGGLIIILAGFLSAQGYFDPGDLIWFAAAGAILGDGFGYYLGTRGTSLFRLENKILKRSHIEKAEAFFKKHGNKSVFLGRFIGPLRAVVPFVAGLGRMNKRAFFFWNIASAFLWSAAYVLIGYFFGGAAGAIAVWSTRVGLILFGLILLTILLWYVILHSKNWFAIGASIFQSIKIAILHNPDVQSFATKHKGALSWIGKRLRMNTFFGLPLTLLSLASVYLLILFLGLVQDIVTSEPIVAIDLRIANLIAFFRHADLVRAFTYITVLGRTQVVIATAIIAGIILYARQKKIYLLSFAIALAGSGVFIWLGKILVHRPRPELAVYVEKSFSFPSGHAGFAVALYGFITYIMVRELRSWQAKMNALFFGIIVISAVGFSRLYLGVHFLSDVGGGYLLGALWLLMAITIAEWRKSEVKPATYGKKKILLTATLLAVWIAFYAFSAVTYHPVRTTGAVSLAFGDNKMPRFTETLIGNPQEPLSFIITAADDAALVRAMNAAGWELADAPTIISVGVLARSVILKENYPRAPITPSFWQTEVNTFGFEKPTPAKNIRERHHARFWSISLATADGKKIYVGTASLDMGIKWLVTHQIKPDIDTERDTLLADLTAAGVVAESKSVQFVPPTLGKNFSGDEFFTDGKLYEMVLK